jgi:hypothetical protein
VLRKFFSRSARPIAALLAAASLIGCSAARFADRSESTASVQSGTSGALHAAPALGRLDPAGIRYSQSSYSLSGLTEEDGLYAVAENIQWLQDHPDQDLPWGGPIRVFRKQAFMDEWGPLSQGGFIGDPKNLPNGEIYTLDHRRLVAYQKAGRKTIPVEWASPSVVRDNRWKFTTSNGGQSIAASP